MSADPALEHPGGRSRGFFLILLCLALFAALAGCTTTPPYRYNFRPGQSAMPIVGGLAAPPSNAPGKVRRAIEAGNRIAGLPYRYGGGHGRGVDSGYDCSGAVSYILMEAGLLSGSRPSVGFKDYGNAGPGEWFSIYARGDHVFLVVADLRYDTGWTGYPQGPRWTPKSRPADGFVIRHPPGW